MSDAADDNYVDVTVKNEYEDVDMVVAREGLILPDINSINYADIKEEPSTFNASYGFTGEDSDELHSDELENIIVYEMNDVDMQEEEVQATPTLPVVTIENCNKPLKVIRQRNKQQLLPTTEDTAAAAITRKRIVAVEPNTAARNTTKSISNIKITDAKTITDIATTNTAKLVTKPSGITTLKQIKPLTKAPTQSAASKPIITFSREQLKRFKATPCVSTRSFRMAKKPLIANANSDSNATPSSNTELKLKCMCRLKPSASPSESIANKMQLKQFFEKMFNETCKLNASQRRIVQTTLLDAICQAETDVEAGKYCEKCYAN